MNKELLKEAKEILDLKETKEIKGRWSKEEECRNNVIFLPIEDESGNFENQAFHPGDLVPLKEIINSLHKYSDKRNLSEETFYKWLYKLIKRNLDIYIKEIEYDYNQLNNKLLSYYNIRVIRSTRLDTGETKEMVNPTQIYEERLEKYCEEFKKHLNILKKFEPIKNDFSDIFGS